MLGLRASRQDAHAKLHCWWWWWCVVWWWCWPFSLSCGRMEGEASCRCPPMPELLSPLRPSAPESLPRLQNPRCHCQYAVDVASGMGHGGKLKETLNLARKLHACSRERGGEEQGKDGEILEGRASREGGADKTPAPDG